LSLALAIFYIVHLWIEPKPYDKEKKSGMAKSTWLWNALSCLTPSIVKNNFAIELNSNGFGFGIRIGGVKCKIPFSFRCELGGYARTNAMELISVRSKKSYSSFVSNWEWYAWWL
jgi:hypothetical protein